MSGLQGHSQQPPLVILCFLRVEKAALCFRNARLPAGVTVATLRSLILNNGGRTGTRVDAHVCGAFGGSYRTLLRFLCRLILNIFSFLFESSRITLRREPHRNDQVVNTHGVANKIKTKYTQIKQIAKRSTTVA